MHKLGHNVMKIVLLSFVSGMSFACLALTAVLRFLQHPTPLYSGEGFAAGFSCAVLAFFLVWVTRRNQAPTPPIHRTKRNSSLKFLSLSHSLEVASNMSSPGGRVMMAVAVGEELMFEHLDRSLLTYLGYPAEHDGPHSVYDILPKSMTFHHRRWVGEVVRTHSLPPRLEHPLRNVQVRDYNGASVNMDLNIKWMPEASPPSFELIFAACQQGAPVPRHINVGEQTEHAEAYVLLLDIMEFTKACSQLTAVEVLHWMRCVRKAVEDLLVAHNMKLIETRGDNYLAITTAEDGPEPAVRAVAFASSAARAVCALQDTRIRVGLARGPVTVARLQCMDQREVLCVFGDVVNVAGRLEQSGDAACIHMSEAVAKRFAADRGLPPPPVRTIVAKGKPEGIRSACWNWRLDRFDSFLDS